MKEDYFEPDDTVRNMQVFCIQSCPLVLKGSEVGGHPAPGVQPHQTRLEGQFSLAFTAYGGAVRYGSTGRWGGGQVDPPRAWGNVKRGICSRSVGRGSAATRLTSHPLTSAGTAPDVP